MDSKPTGENFHHLVSVSRISFVHKAESLLEEHILCSMKIKQLKVKGGASEEQLSLLENLRTEDERRLIELLREHE